MFKKNLLSVALLSVLSGTAAMANATVTLLTNPGQITTSYLNTFESQINSGPVTFQAVQLASASGWAGSVTPSGSMGLSSQGFPQTITASLANSYNAVGMYFGNDDRCCTSGFNAILEVLNGAFSLGSVSVQANMNDYADQFIGLSSSFAFDTVKISYGNVGLYTYIDDFRLGAPASASVPEPSILWLLGSGLLGLLGARGRKAV